MIALALILAALAIFLAGIAIGGCIRVGGAAAEPVPYEHTDICA